MRPAETLAVRTLGDVRVRTLSFALLVVFYAVANAAGYKSEFPTLADRQSFAQSFGNNPALELLYGTPRDLETVGGYAAWRVGGVMSVFAAFFGLWTAVRIFRGEEESGRRELALAGIIARSAAFRAQLAAIGVTVAVLWIALLIGLVAGGLPLGGSAYLALATVSVAAVYAGVGALASQLMPTGRGALELGGALLGLDFLLRVVADTADYQGLHWFLPLGWVEELRAFADPRPAVLVLPPVTAIILLGTAMVLDRRRDVGLARFASHDTRDRPRLHLLGSPVSLALRLEGISLAFWGVGIGGFAFVLGTISKSFTSANLSANLREQMNKFGADVLTPSGVLGLYFIFFVFAITLFCCSQISAVRSEEAAGRLETLFALPASRIRWLADRLGLDVAGAALLGFAAGIGAALGATVVGADVSFPRLIEAGLNCLPASLLFLGIGALLVAAAPRYGVGATYALVSVAFVWELVGSLLDVPSWVLGISPFHQVALVPAEPFRAASAAVMLAIGVVAGGVAIIRFRNRDLIGA
jgi:ABC-2 type transport system permease protein